MGLPVPGALSVEFRVPDTEEVWTALGLAEPEEDRQSRGRSSRRKWMQR